MLFNKKDNNDDFESKIIDNIKALNIDIINTKHNSNFDITLGLTKTLYTLYSKHLRINPNDPNWINRDRVVLSSSSAYSLLLSVLYMSGYNISLNTLKAPYKSDKKIPGIDIISDNFCEGLATSTGIAIGEQYIHEYFKLNNLSNFYTYVICTDLDIIKGTSFEALTLTSALNLNKLIILFDNNKNVLDENEKDVFNIDVIKYFESLKLNTIVVDKNSLSEIDNAISKAKIADKTTVIILNHDSNHERFENNYIDNDYVLTDEETTEVKEELGVRDIPFTVSSEARDAMVSLINERMNTEIEEWNNLYDSLNDDVKNYLERIKNDDFSLINNSISYIPEENDTLDKVCYKLLNSLSSTNPFFVGGTSNYDNSIIDSLSEYKIFDKNNYLGKCINYSLRDSATSAIQNGLSLVGLKNFSITSLKSVNKLISSIRIASEFMLPNIYILIEDEDTLIDGLKTNINDTLVSLRSIDNLDVFRPNDANELIGTFNIINEKKQGTSCIIINKEITNTKEYTSIKDIKKGAYIVKKENKNLSAIIISTGKEIDISYDITNSLTEKGYNIRLISMPSTSLFLKQKDEYKNELLPLGRKVFVIEKASSLCWNQFVFNNKYLITPDRVEWYKNDEDINEFKKEIEEIIENLLK